MGDCELILTGAGASSRTALEAVGRTMAQAFPAYTVRLVCTTPSSTKSGPCFSSPSC